MVVEPSETVAHTSGPKEITPLNQLLEVSIIVMGQALALLQDTVDSDEYLTFESKFVPGSTIGKHLRHAHAHFLLLLDCVHGEKPWIVNYDVRKRDTPMESSVDTAKAACRSVMDRLEELKSSSAVSLDDPVILNAVTPDRQAFNTTFGRELWFAALHAVHHWSMVRVVAAELSLKVEDYFGVAPSTLVYRGTDAALSKAKI